MPSAADEPTSRPHWLWIIVGFAVSLFFLFGWFDQSLQATLSVDTPTRLVIVSDAGRVELSSIPVGEATIIERRDSWLFSEPRFEMAEADGEAMVRVSCPGRFPCRSDLRAEVPVGTEVVVVATRGVVDVRGHDGSLSIYTSSTDGVVLGPIAGSARILSSDGPVNGFHLALDDLEVAVQQSSVRVSFARSPSSVVVSGSENLVQIGLPQRFYRVDVETDSASVIVDVNQSINSNRGIDVASKGPVRVVVSDQ